MTASALFYVQHLLGIGHLQRALRVAEAVAREGIAVTLVCGGEPVALPRDRSIDVVQLTPVRALDARFELVDGAGKPIDDALREERRAALLAAFAATRPDAVVLEGYPFARRAFRFELEPLIAAVRAAMPRPRLVCSVRDIVVMRADPQRHREIVERVRRDFDAVLVHGDPALIPFDASFPATPEIADRVIYTGYVYAPAGSTGGAAVTGGGEVVVSAGGGAAGRALLETALAARRSGCLAGLPWRIIAGNNLPEADFVALKSGAPRALSSRDSVTILLGCCEGAESRSARRGTTRCSTSWPRMRGPSLCRSPPSARPSSPFAPSGWPRWAWSSWCTRMSCRRRNLPQRSSAPPGASRRRSRSILAERCARLGWSPR